MCSTIVNEEQDFSIFLPLSTNPIARETNQKWLKSSMNWNLLGIWWGDFLHFWRSGVCCTCQSPVEAISLCHKHCNPGEHWPPALILFHHGKKHLYMSMSDWAGDYRRIQFHLNKICSSAGICRLFWAVLHFPSPSLFQDLQWHFLPTQSCIPGCVLS